MKTIFKYDLQIVDEQVIAMPERASILTAQVQSGNAKLWAFVDTEKPKRTRKIRVIGTGHPIEEDDMTKLRYISTIQLMLGRLVYHVYEELD